MTIYLLQWLFGPNVVAEYLIDRLRDVDPLVLAKLKIALQPFNARQRKWDAKNQRTFVLGKVEATPPPGESKGQPASPDAPDTSQVLEGG